jgi:hypothetical protein
MRYLPVLAIGTMPFCLAQLPQAAWEGEVDGKVEITIRGNRMDTRELSGPAAIGLKYRVYDPLPVRAQQIRLQSQQGRGTVRIVQQPDSGNNYAAVVTVEDPQAGRSMYAFQLFWDVTNATAPTQNQPGGRPRYTIVDDRNSTTPTYPQVSPGGGASPSTAIPSSQNTGDQYLRWTGTVDDEVIVECRQRDCSSQVQRGANVVRDRVEYTRPLPVQDLRVDLTDAKGRGEIRLVEGPSNRNNYTTRVKIRDTAGGAGDYGFTLRWVAPVAPVSANPTMGLRWTGRVDGKVRVIVEGSNTFVETLAGAPVTDERATFDRYLPAYEGLTPTVTKRRGRGKVELVEFPSRRNNYRIVFTVDDDKGGSDAYEVEIGW